MTMLTETEESFLQQVKEMGLDFHQAKAAWKEKGFLGVEAALNYLLMGGEEEMPPLLIPDDSLLTDVSLIHDVPPPARPSTPRPSRSPIANIDLTMEDDDDTLPPLVISGRKLLGGPPALDTDLERAIKASLGTTDVVGSEDAAFTSALEASVVGHDAGNALDEILRSLKPQDLVRNDPRCVACGSFPRRGRTN